MKFLRMMNHRLMSTAEELDNSAGDSEDQSTDRFFEPQVNDVMKEMGLDPNKYGLDQGDQDEAPKAESHGSEESQEAGQETDENAFLERINALGAIHNDLPIKVESLEDIKNALQMSKDYTVKTQSLSEERKAWDTEKSGAETELNNAIAEFNTKTQEFGTQLQEMQQWTFALNQLKENAPDVFEEVQRAYEGTVRQFSNPVLDQQFAAQNKRFDELEKKLTSREDKLIIDSFDSEKAALSATEQSMKELGVNIDWADVKKQWAATGMPLKSVVGSIYFENVAKAQASKSKVETTAKKVAQKPVGAATGSRPGTKVPSIDRKLNYFDQARELYKNMK